jgi:hypothetical protein
MDPVKNTRLRLILMREEDMSKAKKDVIVVKFTLIGRVCGALVADIY